MKEILVIGSSLPDAYHKALVELNNIDQIIECESQDKKTKQKECSMTVQVLKPLEENRISKLFYGGAYDLQRYLMEMIDGDMDCMIGKVESYPYTYHQRFAPYLKTAIIDELYREPVSRRAIISTRDNNIESGSKDPACLQSIQCFIRPDENGKSQLDMEVVFRSNDLPQAFFMNAFALIRLQEIIADTFNLPVGTYSHRSNSMHCYEKNFKALEKMASRINSNSYEDLDDLTYNYENEYLPDMIECANEIKTLFNQIKERHGV